MATKTKTIVRYQMPKVSKADFDALNKKLVNLRKKTAEAAESQESRLITYGTAIASALYERQQGPLPAVFGIDGKLVFGLAAVGIGEFVVKGDWGDRLASAGDALAVHGFIDATRRGSPFV